MVALKVFDAAANGGLGDIERPGRTRKAALAQYGEEGALPFPIGWSAHTFYTIEVEEIVNLLQGQRERY
ncbi:hypothetical protein GCM10007913_38220 [Devosia yakushimensis]|uniref:Uncharacterized protein n=1 Tax=Devosia yakushimensis TaxID=470028 RepID=A0ABQ5UL29_9HYPH|nr:hypothetical protein GCM10007913_38220 [Devosia yakushimensis]